MAKPTKEEIQIFSTLIEDLSIHLGSTRLDAILSHCESTGLEVEVASTLISPALKSKIREESEKENLVKPSSRLPL